MSHGNFGNRYPTKYTPEQKDAVSRLIVHEGHTATEAVTLAAQGINGLEPFNMPADSAKSYARKYRIALRQNNRLEDSDDPIGELARNTLRELEKKMTELEAQERVDVDELLKLVRSLVALDKILTPGRTRRQQPKPETPSPLDQLGKATNGKTNSLASIVRFPAA